MFGWLKSLFGSEPAQEIVVPPLPPKVKKTAKKAEKPATKKVAVKKEAPKAKAVKAPRKKKENVSLVVDPAPAVEPVVEPVVAPTPKKKGGRPKKV